MASRTAPKFTPKKTATKTPPKPIANATQKGITSAGFKTPQMSNPAQKAIYPQPYGIPVAGKPKPLTDKEKAQALAAKNPQWAYVDKANPVDTSIRATGVINDTVKIKTPIVAAPKFKPWQNQSTGQFRTPNMSDPPKFKPWVNQSTGTFRTPNMSTSYPQSLGAANTTAVANGGGADGGWPGGDGGSGGGSGGGNGSNWWYGLVSWRF